MKRRRETENKEQKRKKQKTSGLKPKGAAQWYRGRLCPIRNEKAWFLKPMAELPKEYPTSKDVFMYPNYISEFVLPVVEGDMLVFILGDRDKTRPMAQKVRVAQYSQRTCKELIEYIRKLIQDLNSVSFKKVLVQALQCTAMWRFLGSPVFKGVPDADTGITYVNTLLSLLKLILRLGKPFKSLLEDVIKTVTRGKMLQIINDRSLPAIIKSCNYSDENDKFCFAFGEQEAFLSAELVRSFCHEAIRQVPSVTRCLLPTVIAISEKIANPLTQSFLCALLSLNTAGENAFIVDTNVWMELPLIPTDHELAGHLVEKDKHLSRVRTNIPYDNPDQYMDTYFRLVRAETFSAMQHGIKDLKASELDLRDMNVYYNIHLAGVGLQSGRFSLAIHFTPTKAVKKWQASPQLMNGNLVCVSINRKFDDVIWATVSNRDADLLNVHQIIMLELLDENIKTVSEIIISLQTQGGSAIMVESPTYYHSLSPVLRSLKAFDMENFPLQQEIVYAKPALELPSYLKGATCHTSIVSSCKNTTLHEVQKDKIDAENGSRNNLAVNGKRGFEEFEAMDTQLGCSSISDAIECLLKERIIININNSSEGEASSDEKGATCRTSIVSSSKITKFHEVQKDKTEAENGSRNNLAVNGKRGFEEFEAMDTQLGCSSISDASGCVLKERIIININNSSEGEASSDEKGATCRTSIVSSSKITKFHEVQKDKTEAENGSRNNLAVNGKRGFEEFEAMDTQLGCSSISDASGCVLKERIIINISDSSEGEDSSDEELVSTAEGSKAIQCEIFEKSINRWHRGLSGRSSKEFTNTPDKKMNAEPERKKNEMLGGRMDVEHFLEIFNSNSESSLEASQCEALIHALKNKLAIIQGPPGCGKTFIGVKIVQLLLSLSPKLEKPILLLTYKNHALDEFLKHMLEFCRKDDLVRIGGRSKEPELESCNLKFIQDHISFDKATINEILSTKNEIAQIESEIEKISANLEASSYLTQWSFIDELTDEQIVSLLCEAEWGTKPIFNERNRRRRRNNLADKSWIKPTLYEASQAFGSVKEFIHMSMHEVVRKENDDAFLCFNVFEKAFEKWFPDREKLQRMTEFQAEFVLQIQTDTTTPDEKATKEAGEGVDTFGEEDDSGDEEHVRQLLEMRMTSGSNGTRIIFNADKLKNRKDVIVEISDYPPDMIVSSLIRSVNNLWSLNETQRLQFLYCILNQRTTSLSQELNNLLEQLHSLKNRKQELEMNDKVELLLQKKIIGVTITGASINHDLIHHIGPSVVIVEEAAEILEPSLLAALTPSLKHLILIGDHKQLRPQVDTWDLCRNFQFDVSMMERLIESGFPFKSLIKQNRMRPEFSALLHDIYPNLEDNLPLVSKNHPLKCIGKSMFFWSHDDPEKHDRTYSNVKEAERVIALVLYLLWCGCLPSEITVLAAYLGQTKLLRSMMKQEKTDRPELFQEDNGRNKDGEGFVQVQTVDMYQGDENKYVIISLVRSNKEKRIGFLKERNRRCVAQSRAKCGMYFVGNVNTLRGAKASSCWSKIIMSMMEQDCVANEFPLQCVKHEVSKYKALDGNNIREVIAKPTLLCKQLCGDPVPFCDKHVCKRLCFPRHEHYDCLEMVADQFPGCGHDVMRRCPRKISSLFCKKEVIADLPCGHKGVKECSEDVSRVICKIPVTATFPRCKHQTEKECHVKIETMTCMCPCSEMNSCGIHPCKKDCGGRHGHDRCQEKIHYMFPRCGHPSSEKKKCFQEIIWNCKFKVYFKGACGHDMMKKCYQSESNVKCLVTPCGKIRKSCGHPCINACGDDCEKGDCKLCQRVYEKKMVESRAAATAKVKELEEKIKKKEIPSFSRDVIRGTGAAAAEYQKVEDQVLKFIQPCRNWFPRITMIEKVTNLVLEKKFETAKSRAFGDYIDTKFHSTSNIGVQDIVRNGFKMPEAKPLPSDKTSMYGHGIYFATDASKSAQEIYTKGSRQLLLCQVILGKSMTVDKADYTLNKKKLRSYQYDSVYAPRGTAVKNDEFVIFDPGQALPQYVIHFSDTKTVVPPSPSAHTSESVLVKKMLPSRAVDFQDPFQMHYYFAESHFRRMAAKSSPPLSPEKATISSIDIVINKDLEDKFEATKQKFKSQGIPDQEILAYHGTDKKNIDSILESNLQLSFAKRQVYGKGNYFSEFPAVSLGYGDGLLLCRILPGKEFVDSTRSDIPPGHNSKKVLKSQPAGAAAANASGEMIIIENSDQILPYFVIHR